MLKRRHFLGFALGGGATAALSRPAFAQSPSSGTANGNAYGLVANVAHDQSEALQHAINDSTRRGQALHLPAGRYLASGLVLPPGATLIGTPGLTLLVQSGSRPILRAEGTKRLRVSDLVLDGAGRTIGGTRGALLTIRGCEAISVRNIEFTHTPGCGLVLEGCGGAVEGSTFKQIGDAGLFALDSRGLRIDGNAFSDIGNNAIQVWRSQKGEDGTLVSHNRISHVGARDGGNGQNGNGVNIFRAGAVVVSANTIRDCAFSGIRNNGGSNVIVTANSITRAGEVAIFIEFAFEGASIANNMIDEAAAGISVSNFDSGGRLASVVGNVVRGITAKSLSNPDTLPYGIAVEADTTVIGNTVENVPGVGIRLGWGPYLRNVTASANVVRESDIGIAVSLVNGAGKVIVADNIIAGSKTALAGMEWQKKVTGDLTRAADGQQANLTFARNRAG